MPRRRAVLAALASGLAGCYTLPGGVGRETRTRGRWRSPTATATPPSSPSPRASPLSVDGAFRWAAPFYDVANTLRVPTTAPREAPDVLWEAWLGGDAYAPLVDGERLLTFGEEGLWVVDRRDGRVRRSTTIDFTLASPPTLVDGGLVAGYRTVGDDAEEGEVGVVRFDDRGRVDWRTELITNRVLGPTVAHGLAYVATEGALVALDVETGEEVWRHVGKDGNSMTSWPGVRDGVVYVSGAQESLYAVDAATGDRIWRYGTGTYRPLSNVPTVGEHLVFAGAGNSVAIGRELGARAWSVAGGTVVSHALSGDTVIAATREGRVQALSRPVGAVEWAVDGVAGRPVVTEGSVVVRGQSGRTGDEGLVALDRTGGTTRWTHDLDGEGWALVADGYVYVSRPGGVLQCLG